MSLSDDDTKQTDTKPKDNVVRLGTETLFAIGDELRRMYEADLRSQPSEELERLVRQIERGEDVSEPARARSERRADSQPDDAAT
jgi:hypothetical protein